MDLAARSSTACEFGHGLLGFILPPLEWLGLLFPVGHVAVAFVPVPPPGAAPLLPGGATALQVSVHNALFASWKYSDERYQLQQVSLNAFKGIFIASLDCVTRRLITDPLTGTRNVTIQDIDARLFAAHGILSPSDLRANEASLREPYHPDRPIREHTSTHQELHAIAQANGNPISDAQQVDFLITSLRPCGLFNGRIDHWVIAFPTVALQRFQDLADALHLYADNRTPDLTTSSAGYSAAVRPALDVSSTSRLKAYCWSHGTCSHSSKDCTKRKIGHEDTASFANTKGGSNFVYPAYR